MAKEEPRRENTRINKVKVKERNTVSGTVIPFYVDASSTGPEDVLDQTW